MEKRIMISNWDLRFILERNSEIYREWRLNQQRNWLLSHAIKKEKKEKVECFQRRICFFLVTLAAIMDCRFRRIAKRFFQIVQKAALPLNKKLPSLAFTISPKAASAEDWTGNNGPGESIKKSKKILPSPGPSGIKAGFIKWMREECGKRTYISCINFSNWSSVSSK